MKKALLALAGLALAGLAVGQTDKYKDWDKSPEAYFLTPAERAEWNAVSTDEAAEAFIALYYARRGGEPFKQEISRRIAAADQQFKMQRYKRGADSVRGHLLVVLGLPSRVSQERAQAGVDDTGGVTAPAIDTRSADASSAILYTWTYDKSRFDPSWDLPEIRAVINVEPAFGKDSLRNAALVEKAMATIAEKSIVNPNATIVPAGAARPAASAPAGAAPAGAGGGAAAGSAAAAAPPVPVPVMPMPAGVRSALEAAAGKSEGEAAFWSGPFRTPSGEPFLAIQYYLASNKPAFASGAPLKFGAIVRDESGKEVDSIWEDAVFSEIDEAGRKDRALDHSFALPPGSYKGVFGLFPAEGQTPVASTSVSFTLDPKSDAFGVSPLLLSSGLVPLKTRPAPTDPFVFGTEKPIKVEPKGDGAFAKQDSLWYFFTVSNPIIPASPAAVAPAADSATAPGAPAAAPAPAAETPRPRIMTRINVQKDGQDAFAPFTGPAELQPIGTNYYATGTEIPLASFEPGYYTFVILVRDLNAERGSAANKGLERREDFVVLMPDGSMPPRKAAAPPAKPKKK